MNNYNPIPIPNNGRASWDANFFSKVPLNSFVLGHAPMLHLYDWERMSNFFGTLPNIDNSNCIWDAINSDNNALNDFNAMTNDLKKSLIYFLENKCYLIQFADDLPDSIKRIIQDCFDKSVKNYNNVEMNKPNPNIFYQKYMKYKIKYLNLKKQY
jgi:hypothetical protein